MKRMFIIVSSLLVFVAVSQPLLAKSFQTETRTAEFTAADLDASNSLTLAELEAYFDGQIASRFTALDTDANAALSLGEFTVNENAGMLAFASEIFNLADADLSGDLSADEFTAIAPHNGSGEILRNFAQMDTDFDLLVTLEEYTSKSNRGFGKGGKKGGRQSFGHR